MTAPDAAQLPEREAPPCPPSIVEDVLKILDKAVRAHQLYMHNNPTYLKAVENARRAFDPLWQQVDELVLQVTETQLTWYDVPVHVQPDKAGDSLPWLFFKDGLRELTILPGFEQEELDRFLAIIPKVRHAQAHEDDLLTLLWEQEFEALRYRYVELGDGGAATLEASADPGRWPVPAGQEPAPLKSAIDEAREEQAKAGAGDAAAPRPSGLIRIEDFDATLYFLDQHEVEYLKQETQREYALDLRRLTVSALLDIFELQVDPLVRAEVGNDLEALVLHLLSAGQFSSVAFLLREIEGTMQRARELKPADRERLGRLSERLSHPDSLAQMLQALEESSALPPADELAQLFAELKPTALVVLLEFTDRTVNAALKPLLEGAADRLAQSNTAELVKLVKAPKVSVARQAIRRAGSMKAAAAVPALGELLAGGADRELRTVAVAALTEIGTPGALSALEVALGDEDRDIRVATLRALAARTHRPALAKVEAMVGGKMAKDADRTERIALFELFGSICGDGGVPMLDGILSAKGGLFARKEDPELRACAAVALGKVGSAAARKALEKAVGEKDVIVKAAVSRALRGGGA
ncbi:MAG: HEAT repeat domain-containing protein [Gemmatimonadales bacterium]|nr:HEAT repeat domain-containing protein [Gemmatimonadota bacterium]MCL4213576.1 HEAT repeat domain-containing protein [Gemmatimonadales bacterium]